MSGNSGEIRRILIKSLVTIQHQIVTAILALDQLRAHIQCQQLQTPEIAMFLRPPSSLNSPLAPCASPASRLGKGEHGQSLDIERD